MADSRPGNLSRRRGGRLHLGAAAAAVGDDFGCDVGEIDRPSFVRVERRHDARGGDAERVGLDVDHQPVAAGARHVDRRQAAGRAPSGLAAGVEGQAVILHAALAGFRRRAVFFRAGGGRGQPCGRRTSRWRGGGAQAGFGHGGGLNPRA